MAKQARSRFVVVVQVHGPLDSLREFHLRAGTDFHTATPPSGTLEALARSTLLGLGTLGAMVFLHPPTWLGAWLWALLAALGTALAAWSLKPFKLFGPEPPQVFPIAPKAGERALVVAWRKGVPTLLPEGISLLSSRPLERELGDFGLRFLCLTELPAPGAWRSVKLRRMAFEALVLALFLGLCTQPAWPVPVESLVAPLGLSEGPRPRTVRRLGPRSVPNTLPQRSASPDLLPGYMVQGMFHSPARGPSLGPSPGAGMACEPRPERLPGSALGVQASLGTHRELHSTGPWNPGLSQLWLAQDPVSLGRCAQYVQGQVFHVGVARGTPAQQAQVWRWFEEALNAPHAQGEDRLAPVLREPLHLVLGVRRGVGGEQPRVSFRWRSPRRAALEPVCVQPCNASYTVRLSTANPCHADFAWSPRPDARAWPRSTLHDLTALPVS